MGRGRGRGRAYAEEAAAAEAARQAAMLSHADLVASARRDTGPLSIDGGLLVYLSGYKGAHSHRRRDVCCAPHCCPHQRCTACRSLLHDTSA